MDGWHISRLVVASIGLCEGSALLHRVRPAYTSFRMRRGHGFILDSKQKLTDVVVVVVARLMVVLLKTTLNQWAPTASMYLLGSMVKLVVYLNTRCLPPDI